MENPPPPIFLTYLSQAQPRLLTSITFSASALSQTDRESLSNLINFLQKDSENCLRGDQREPLPNQGLGQTGTSSLVDAYKEAIMGAYAVYMGELSLAHGPSAER